MAREATNKLLQMIDDGLVSQDYVITAALKYMSEDEVRDMCHANDIELFLDEDDDDEYEDDGQPTEYEEWMSFDPDC